MSRLGRRFGWGRGSGTRVGSKGCGLLWTLGRPALLAGSQRDGGLWPVLLVKASEISHLLLQRSELSLQGAKPLGEREERGRQRWQSALKGGRWLWWEGSQAALMQA